MEGVRRSQINWCQIMRLIEARFTKKSYGLPTKNTAVEVKVILQYLEGRITLKRNLSKAGACLMCESRMKLSRVYFSTILISTSKTCRRGQCKPVEHAVPIVAWLTIVKDFAIAFVCKPPSHQLGCL